MNHRLGQAAVLLALALGAGLTFWGLSRLSWPLDLPRQGMGLRLQVMGFLLSVLVIRYAAGRLRVRPAACVLVFAAVCALASGNAAAIPACALVVLSCAVLGRIALRFVGLPRDAAEPLVPCVLAGAGIFGTAIALTAAWTIHFPWSYLLVLALPLLLARREAQDVAASAWRAISDRRAPAPDTSIWLASLAAAVACVYVAVAFLPEIGHDALAMHLFVMHQLASRHAWAFDAQTYVWAVMPMLGDWIFAIPYMLGGEASARLANVGFLLAIAWMLRELVRWAGGTDRGAQWTLLIFLSTPLTFTEGSSLFIESVWASFVIAAVLALARACVGAGGGVRELVLCALFAGFALASKAVTLTILPLLALGLVVFWREWMGRGAAKSLATGALLFAAVGSIPYANAWRLTGNPVFPFFNAVFRSPLYPPQNFESASVFGKGVTWDLPYRVTFDAGRYLEATAGAGGFQWLLVVLPAILALLLADRRRALALAAFAIAALILAFNSVSYLRYVFPSFALLSVVVGVAVSAHVGKALAWGWAVMALGAAALNLLFLGAGSAYRDLPLAAVFDSGRRAEWLESRAPIRPAVHAVNSLNDGGTPVALLARPGALGGLGATLSSVALMASWYNPKFTSALAEQREPEAIARLLDSWDVEYLILSDAWPQPQHGAIESVTDPLSRHGDLSVRRLALRYRYQDELIKEPAFGSVAPWSFANGARGNAKQMTVTVSAPAFQAVAVRPGRRYLNTVELQCPEPAAARLQVNWLDAKSTLIRSDIRVIECSTEPSTESMEVTAPKRASQALVYASAHTDKPVTFKRNSFRQ